MAYLTEVPRPVQDVARQILEYEDPESGLRIFELMGFNPDPDQPLVNNPSIDDPATLEQDEFAVVHKYHSEHCTVTDPADPRYLSTGTVIADINKSWETPTETMVRWRHEWRKDENHAPGYEKLERLLSGE